MSVMAFYYSLFITNDKQLHSASLAKPLEKKTLRRDKYIRFKSGDKCLYDDLCRGMAYQKF